MKNKICSILFFIAVFFFIITFSIGLPIYFRPFYYMQVEALDLEETSGYDRAEIREAYDEVLDYLTLPGKSFGTGIMAYSEMGKSHFADCKSLFTLNAAVLSGSIVIICVLSLLKKVGKLKAYTLGRFSSCFWAAVSALGSMILIGAAMLWDFFDAFILFHKIFFPGKNDWYFDPFRDEIINILPERFFFNCAVFIVCAVLIISLSVIVIEMVKKSNFKNN